VVPAAEAVVAFTVRVKVEVADYSEGFSAE
jgi:hypothetical protein